MPASQYVIQPDDHTFCPRCTHPVKFLVREDGAIGHTRNPAFYICFYCDYVTQCGVGEVKAVSV